MVRITLQHVDLQFYLLFFLLNINRFSRNQTTCTVYLSDENINVRLIYGFSEHVTHNTIKMI